MRPMNFQEAQAAWQAHRARHERFGAVALSSVRSYTPDEYKHDYEAFAMDAQPTLVTDPNSAVPVFLTTLIDPTVYEVLWSPNMIAEIFGEQKKGSWVDTTAMFPVVEHSGEVSSYGDYAENGRAGANVNWPQRQNYLFQTMIEYGELELERAGLARINWAGELDGAAALVMSKFMNLSYAFGINGLQNYGLLNDPNLTASLTPATKAAGGTRWVASNIVVATANEVYADIQSMYIALVNQNAGLVDAKANITLSMSPQSETALTATNSFNVNVYDLLKKNFPNLKVKTAVQYGALSTTNPQGIAAGELVQMMVDAVEGQDVGYASFSEKMRQHRIIPATTSWKKKITGGTWGAIVRYSAGISSMLGV